MTTRGIQPGQLLTAKTLNALVRSTPSTTPSRRVGMLSLPNGSIVRPRRQWAHMEASFWAILGAATPDATPNRWTYAWNEAIKSSAGIDGWAVRPSGRSNLTHGPAMNRYEVINSGVGVQGNGVNVDNLPQGFTIQPIPAGTPVRIELVRLADGSAYEAWFAEANGVDGVCP